ncbi:glutaredoxin family protein [Kocuria sp. SL71]|uniref:glutaredoxin family protein n=1 Tax=Kocuria sp. SL71 TaxID=2995151 RepID=UPI002DD41CB0|nr:glutaredoxin family protein [Kocuria sp. SL71]
MTTVYTKPQCIQCDRTQAHLTKHNVAFHTRDITTDPEAHRYITETLGYQQAPVVVTDDGQHWSGYRPDKLAQLATAQHAPSAAEITGPTISPIHFQR